MGKIFLTNQDIIEKVEIMADTINHDFQGLKKIYGVPRGGIPVAYLLSKYVQGVVVDNVEQATIVVDDIIDSGKTRNRFNGKPFYAIIDKLKTPDKSWYVFPWERNENDESATDIPLRMLQYIGENINRDGLKDTPQRILKSWDALYVGYKQDPKEILGKVFDNEEKYNEMVVLKEIEFTSFCEHHNLPFFGKAHIAYIPVDKVVGISKLARLLDCFAKRMQIQERLTQQVVNAIEENLHPLGAACMIEAQHLCMKARGVGKQDSIMVTSALSGVFKTSPETRAEFLSLIGRKV
jgi:GTP cyclohydrolase I